MFEFLRRRPSNLTFQRSRARVAQLALEVLEPRTVMSASTGDDEIATTAGASSDASAQGVQAAAIIKDQAGDTLKTAKNLGTLTGTKAVSDFVGATDTADFYKFTVSGTTGLTFRMNGLSNNADLFLLDSKGKQIAASIEVGTEVELIDTQLAKGTYYIQVVPVDTAATTYSLIMTAVKDTGADQIKKAYNVGAMKGSEIILTEQVGGMDYHDVYKFTMTKQGSLPISLTGLSADADLRLYNSRGQAVAWSSYGGTSDELLELNLGKGTFYVDVVPFSGARTSYVLTIGSNVAVPTPDPEPDPILSPFPDVPNYGGANDWNLNSIKAPEVWAKGYTGTGVVVAVLDTGVAYTHTELVNQMWTNTGETAGDGIDNDGNGFIDDIRGWDFAYGDNNPSDLDDHGTHVSGTIAGARNNTGVTGVAYGAKIMAVKVLGDDGNGYWEDIAAGIRYAVDNGAQVINMSLGGGAPVQIVSDAIAYAAANNVFIVAASGNDGASTPGWPARYSSTFSNVLSVGAYDINNFIANFTNGVGTSGAVQVDAPGVNIYSSIAPTGFANFNGTSMASPHVAGLAALMLSANPNLSAAQIRNIIVATTDLDISGSDSRQGINAAYAVAGALQPNLVPNITSSGSAARVLGGGGGGTASSKGLGAGTPLDTTLPINAESPIAIAAASLVREAVSALSIGRGSVIEGVFSQLEEVFHSRTTGLESSLAVRSTNDGSHEDWFSDSPRLDAVFASLGASV